MNRKSAPRGNRAVYWLCVFASGSLCISIFSCFTLISVSCLHFGQNRGKFFNSVSSRIFSLVLFLQTGHKINSVSFIGLRSLNAERYYLSASCKIINRIFNFFSVSYHKMSPTFKGNKGAIRKPLNGFHGICIAC